MIDGLFFANPLPNVIRYVSRFTVEMLLKSNKVVSALEQRLVGAPNLG